MDFVRPGYYTCTDGFALKTFVERLPRIVGDVQVEDERLTHLLQQIVQDEPPVAVQSLPEPASLAHLRAWNKVWLSPGVKHLSQLPFLHVEIYMYTRMLEACQFHTNRVDFFRQQKDSAVAKCLPDIKRALNDWTPGVSLDVLLRRSLWGNKLDLSLHQLQDVSVGAPQDSRNLLVDRSAAVACALHGHIHIVLDNVAHELFNDLLLVRELLRRGHSVTLHCKAFPIFVSDVTLSDYHSFLETLRHLEHGPAMVQDLQNDRLVVRDHCYWNSPFEWFQNMPQELLADCSVLLVKGDANFRKLVGARRYAHSTPFGDCVAYLGLPVCALRCLKCDLSVGLSEQLVEALDEGNEPDWRVNGTKGVILFNQ